MYLSIFLLVSENLLLCQALPLVFLILPHKSLVIFVVFVSPLLSLMEDQVSHLKQLGLKAAHRSSREDGERTRVESGEYSFNSLRIT